ncbi:hypothetical protein [Herbaspirillum sp. NPDC101397]|uniref:hypothetical protein n=1 Tax=Herbaspirillum sp. NPDC101397 TaxID=3364006 RepID=UPI00383A997C
MLPWKDKGHLAQHGRPMFYFPLSPTLSLIPAKSAKMQFHWIAGHEHRVQIKTVGVHLLPKEKACSRRLFLRRDSRMKTI